MHKMNFKRPLVLACDEYYQVATEIEGQIGDAEFFSVSRQNGCMGIIATQSVSLLEISSLGRAWKAIFGNFGATIAMRLSDPDTVRVVSELMGKGHFLYQTRGSTVTEDGGSRSKNGSFVEMDNLRTEILVGLERGEGAVIGTLDGVRKPELRFIKVEKPEEP